MPTSHIAALPALGALTRCCAVLMVPTFEWLICCFVWGLCVFVFQFFMAIQRRHPLAFLLCVISLLLSFFWIRPSGD